MNCLIYDCESAGPNPLLEQLRSDSLTVINASQPAAKCTGCFRCWVKTPGKCVFSDQLQQIGSRLMTSGEVMIVCKSLYGGFSIGVKRLLDRAIPGVLPFFEKASGELHHRRRYPHTPVLRVFFYNGGEMTGPERKQALEAAAAVALNFHMKEHTVVFAEDLAQALREVRP